LTNPLAVLASTHVVQIVVADLDVVLLGWVWVLKIPDHQRYEMSYVVVAAAADHFDNSLFVYWYFHC
jgi:hypothetical protein